MLQSSPPFFPVVFSSVSGTVRHGRHRRDHARALHYTASQATVLATKGSAASSQMRMQTQIRRCYLKGGNCIRHSHTRRRPAVNGRRRVHPSARLCAARGTPPGLHAPVPLHVTYSPEGARASRPTRGPAPPRAPCTAPSSPCPSRFCSGPPKSAHARARSSNMVRPASVHLH